MGSARRYSTSQFPADAPPQAPKAMKRVHSAAAKAAAAQHKKDLRVAQAKKEGREMRTWTRRTVKEDGAETRRAVKEDGAETRRAIRHLREDLERIVPALKNGKNGTDPPLLMLKDTPEHFAEEPAAPNQDDESLFREFFAEELAELAAQEASDSEVSLPDASSDLETTEECLHEGDDVPLPNASSHLETTEECLHEDDKENPFKKYVYNPQAAEDKGGLQMIAPEDLEDPENLIEGRTYSLVYNGGSRAGERRTVQIDQRVQFKSGKAAYRVIDMGADGRDRSTYLFNKISGCYEVKAPGPPSVSQEHKEDDQHEDDAPLGGNVEDTEAVDDGMGENKDDTSSSSSDTSSSSGSSAKDEAEAEEEDLPPAEAEEEDKEGLLPAEEEKENDEEEEEKEESEKLQAAPATAVALHYYMSSSKYEPGKAPIETTTDRLFTDPEDSRVLIFRPEFTGTVLDEELLVGQTYELTYVQGGCEATATIGETEQLYANRVRIGERSAYTVTHGKTDGCYVLSDGAGQRKEYVAMNIYDAVHLENVPPKRKADAMEAAQNGREAKKPRTTRQGTLDEFFPGIIRKVQVSAEAALREKEYHATVRAEMDLQERIEALIEKFRA